QLNFLIDFSPRPCSDRGRVSSHWGERSNPRSFHLDGDIMQRFFLLVLSVFLFLLLPLVEAGEKNLDLILRRRLASKTDAGEIYQAVEAKQKWSPKQTAIIVCDMWDTHHCYNAVQRVEEIAPRM